MLESNHRSTVDDLLTRLHCEVELPEEWGDFLQESGEIPSHDERRKFIRYYFRRKAVLSVLPTLPAVARSATDQIVYLRDLSQQGLSFFHHEQLFPEENCRLRIPERELTARVVRCLRYGGKCWLIGAKLGAGSEC